MALCPICNGKCYIIATRDDGRVAVERCDTCCMRWLSDLDAARLALSDGIKCKIGHPAYVEEEPTPASEDIKS